MDSNASKPANVSPGNLTWLYNDEADRRKHMHYIASIAAENHKDIREVGACYEDILGDLRSQARVHDFLNIFVAKKVLEKLRASP
jgi:hypothetical protein